MRRRNVDIHGPKAPPSATQSRIAGLTMRYEMNKQMIGFWRSYQTAGRLLFREYTLSRAYPECCKTLSEGQEWAANQIVELMGIQEALRAEIDLLTGQLPLPVPEAEI
jgi:hypothetical protein